MNPALKNPLIYLLLSAIIAGTWLWTVHAKSEASRYSIESSSPQSRTFLLDKKTGRVWRYYVNMDQNNKPITEGFSLIHEATYSDRAK